MTGSFNGQILIDKLSKLNCSQQSIETLSHWCIFHRKNAKQVVETWVSQFHCSPREQRVSFLYLANDILQNSRRKGSEFVVEFWRVLPDALNDVLENGNDSDKRAALRLVGIWEERKVFGSRGHVLKEEILGRNVENIKNIEKISNDKLKSYIGDVLEKIISRYKHVYESSLDEEAIMGKCQSAFSCIEKLEKDNRNPQSVGANGGEVHGDFEGPCATLRQCVEQLKASELSRTLLISHLREAVRDEELKMEQLRSHLQVAESHLEVACNIHDQLNRSNGKLTPEKRAHEVNQISEQNSTSAPDPAERTGDRERTAPVMYTQQCNFPDNPSQSEDEHRKSTAAAVAARLAASTSSAEMLSYVLSSLASEGVIGQQAKEDHSSGDNKRPKLDNGAVSYTPTAPMQQVSLPFPQPESLHQTSQSLHQQPSASVPPQGIPLQALPQSQSLPPLQPPLHPNQFMQNAGALPNMSYSYGSTPPLQRPPQLAVYQTANMPPYPVHPGTYQNGQQMESGGFNQPPLPGTLPPFSRQ